VARAFVIRRDDETVDWLSKKLLLPERSFFSRPRQKIPARSQIELQAVYLAYPMD
jgi:hypothetical protein